MSDRLAKTIARIAKRKARRAGDQETVNALNRILADEDGLALFAEGIAERRTQHAGDWQSFIEWLLNWLTSDEFKEFLMWIIEILSSL